MELSLPKVVKDSEQYYQDHKHKLKNVSTKHIRGLIRDMENEQNYELCTFFNRILTDRGETMDGEVVWVLSHGDKVKYEGCNYTYLEHCPTGCHVYITDGVDNPFPVESNQIEKVLD